MASSDVSKFYFTYDYENGTGELYMRVGIAIFAICSMIDRALSLIQMVETSMNSYSITFFIFKYANIVINFGKNSAVIGLIHLVSTNFCVFFRTVVRETVDEIRHHHMPIHEAKKHIEENYSHYRNELTARLGTLSNSSMIRMKQLGCVDTMILTSDISIGLLDAQEKIRPYLYPCVIEYSLMCLTVFYILWASIEQRYDLKNKYGNWGIGNEEKTKPILNPNVAQMSPQDKAARFASFSHEKRHVNQFVIDCGKSTTGLFFGIFALLFTIISLIIYFIYKSDNASIAIKISEVTELILVCFSFLTVVLILIKFKMSKFNYKLQFDLGYNETLTILGLAGIYIFGFYSIIALFENGIENYIEMFSVMIQISSIVEATLQTVLIIEGLKMYTTDRSVKKNKPGRSLLTLLILLDVSLWLSETFSVKKYDMNTIQLDYYDTVFWSIVSSVSSPLAIFFRFHASVCLSDMWKTLYE